LDSWDIRSLGVQPHQPKVLRTDKEARLIAINLPSGERMQEHRTFERGYLMVVDGEIELADGGNSQTGGPGFLAHFEPKEDRAVKATQDSLLVLILGPWPGEGHHT
jgi:quercetin dioxygenase-like cupin family protein